MAIPPFHETQFPVTLSMGAKGGPGFNTTVTEIASGFEGRNPNWTAQRYAFDVSHLIKSDADIQQLLTFFYCRRGRAYGFRFKDWHDYTAVNEPIVSTPAGLMLAKFYDDPVSPFTRLITKPVRGGIADASGYIPPTISGGGSIDYTTGIVSSGGTWSGEFDVPVRFDADDAQVILNAFNDAAWEGIRLIEIRDWPIA